MASETASPGLAARTWAKKRPERIVRARLARFSLAQAGWVERNRPGMGEISGAYQPIPKPSAFRGSGCSLAR